MAAGIALVREAGGFVTDLEGRDVSLASAGILAANEPIHRELLRVLSETRKA
jgi:myo-inositol-1(or 4)-monophosphatase